MAMSNATASIARATNKMIMARDIAPAAAISSAFLARWANKVSNIGPPLCRSFGVRYRRHFGDTATSRIGENPTRSFAHLQPSTLVALQFNSVACWRTPSIGERVIHFPVSLQKTQNPALAAAAHTLRLERLARPAEA